MQQLLRVDQAVDCGLWNVVPPLQWLCEVVGYWQKPKHAVVRVDPEHPKQAQWMTCLVSMKAMAELGHFQLPGMCIIMLKVEVMAANEWYDNGPQELILVSLCIQIGNNKINCVCCP